MIKTQATEVSVGKAFRDPQWQKFVFAGFDLSAAMGFGEGAPLQRGSEAHAGDGPQSPGVRLHRGYVRFPTELKVTRSLLQPSLGASRVAPWSGLCPACAQRVTPLSLPPARHVYCIASVENPPCPVSRAPGCPVGSAPLLPSHARDLRLHEPAWLLSLGRRLRPTGHSPRFWPLDCPSCRYESLLPYSASEMGITSPRSRLWGVIKVYRIKLYPRS